MRHLLAILTLPFTVVAVVPYLLLRGRADAAGQVPAAPWADVAGPTVFAAGLGLFLWCVWLFGARGRGTLAPWDPTRRLVVEGPYAIVRNPMITGVAAMLLGEAVLFRSMYLLAWFMAFVAVNHVYFLTSEEPGLRRRFGRSYDRYARRVPRWLPGRLPLSR